MRSALVLAAILGLATAAPRAVPQAIDVIAVEAIPTPTILGPELAAFADVNVYNPAVAASEAAALIPSDPISKRSRSRRRDMKRDTCPLEPDGTGPIPGDGSVRAYLASDSILAEAACTAPTPEGYTAAFIDFQSSTTEIGYLTFSTLNGTFYDPSECAAKCNSEQYCLGFNVYFERDPMYTPGFDCPNPPPVTNIKCALYGYPVSPETATNTGDHRGPQDPAFYSFQVVIAGSNGYNKISSPSLRAYDSFTSPTQLPAAINAPNDTVTNQDTYMGMKLYNNGPYDPAQCAAACTAQTAYDREHPGTDGTYDACNFFNAYILSRDGVPLGTYCAFYTRVWGAQYATNVGYFAEGGAVHYTVDWSEAFALEVQESGKI